MPPECQPHAMHYSKASIGEGSRCGRAHVDLTRESRAERVDADSASISTSTYSSSRRRVGRRDDLALTDDGAISSQGNGVGVGRRRAGEGACRLEAGPLSR